MLGCRHIPAEEYSFHGFPAIRRASCCTYIGETHCQTIGGKRIDQVVTVFLEVVRRGRPSAYTQSALFYLHPDQLRSDPNGGDGPHRGTERRKTGVWNTIRAGRWREKAH